VAKRLALSLVLGFALFAGLLALATLLCLKLDLPQQALPLAAIPMAGFGAFLAAYCNVRKVRRQGLLLGLLAGAAFYLVVLLLTLGISRAPLGMNAVILLLVSLLSGAAGGIVSVNRGGAPHKKKRH
jgi:putative membrane protein (TIGR04086 family)